MCSSPSNQNTNGHNNFRERKTCLKRRIGGIKTQEMFVLYISCACFIEGLAFSERTASECQTRRQCRCVALRVCHFKVTLATCCSAASITDS